jgi:tetratricopeptide (TPR) repeat protein
MDHSLIWRTDDPNQPSRYEMLVTLREYALERLEQRGELADCRNRHAAYFDLFADDKFDELRDFRQVAAARSLETEQPNLRLALEWCCSTPANLEIGMRLASHLWEFWQRHADHEEGCTWMRRLLAQPGAAVLPFWRAHLLNGLAELTQMQIPQARIWLEESLAIFRELGDRYGQAWVLCHLGTVAIWGREYDQARARLKESFKLFRQLGADWHIAWILCDLAEIAIDMKQFPEAESHLERSLELFEHLGDRRAMAECHSRYGAIARHRMDFPSAIRSYGEALRLARIVGDLLQIAFFSFYLADAYLRNGDLAEATPRLLQRLWFSRQWGDSVLVAYCLIDLARVAVARQSASQAAGMVGAASSLLDHVVEFHRNFARIYLFPQAEQEIRLQLSDQAFDQAWQNGRKSLDGVLKFLSSWEENAPVPHHPRDFSIPRFTAL